MRLSRLTKAGQRDRHTKPRTSPQQPHIAPQIHHKMKTPVEPKLLHGRSNLRTKKWRERYFSPLPNDSLVRPVVARTVVIARRRRRRIPAAELRIRSHWNTCTEPVQLCLRHSGYIRRLRQMEHQDRLRRQRRLTFARSRRHPRQPRHPHRRQPHRRSKRQLHLNQQCSRPYSQSYRPPGATRNQ